MRRTVLLLVPCALLLLPALMFAHGPAAYVAAGGGSPSTSPSPGPAPAPAPAPAPLPGMNGPGGVTPGTGPANGTPGRGPHGAPGPAGRGIGGGRGPMYKSKVNRTDRHWLGASKLAWEAAFLPKNENSGYGARELSLDEAAKGLGGEHAWNLKDRPSVVVVYDTGNKNEVVKAGQLDMNPDFIAASKYFNLLRVDSKSIDSKKQVGKGLAFVLYGADRSRVTTLDGRFTPKTAVAAMKTVIEKDYRKSGAQAIAQMQAVLARRALLENKQKDFEADLFDTKTGAKNVKAADRLARVRRELKKLDAEEKALLAR